MPIVYGQVGAPSNISSPDTANLPLLQGKQAEGVVTELHGKYYTQSYRNNAFIGATAAGGVVPPNYSTTAQTFGIWNPAGSGKNAMLIAIDFGLVTLGTPAVSSLALSYTPNAGSALATGQISAITTAAPLAAIIGNTAASVCRFTPSAATTLASTFLMPLPFSYFTTTTTTVATAAANLLHYDFDGSVGIAPNNALWVCANILTGSTWNISLRWYEPPV
jgi:hypothetical protein